MLLFYYTMCVLICTIFVSATCFAGYLVTRRRTFLYGCVAFFFYFFDVVLVFRTAYHPLAPALDPAAGIYAINSPVESVLLGTGVFASLWLLACGYLERPTNSVIPIIGVYIGASVLAYYAIPTPWIREFAFFTVRGACMLTLLTCILITYHRSTNPMEKVRLRPQLPFLVGCYLLDLGTIAWNVYFMVLRPRLLPSDAPPFLPERNLMENMLMLLIGAWLCQHAMVRLAIFSDEPPETPTPRREEFIQDRVRKYATQMQLSERETEVLGRVIAGETYQAIATALYVSPSTVKVHVHNILKKTQATDRADLVKHFWHHV